MGYAGYNIERQMAIAFSMLYHLTSDINHLVQIFFYYQNGLITSSMIKPWD